MNNMTPHERNNAKSAVCIDENISTAARLRLLLIAQFGRSLHKLLLIDVDLHRILQCFGVFLFFRVHSVARRLYQILYA